MKEQRYTIIYSVTKDRWRVNRFRSEEVMAGPFKTRAEAVAALEKLEAKS